MIRGAPLQTGWRRAEERGIGGRGSSGAFASERADSEASQFQGGGEAVDYADAEMQTTRVTPVSPLHHSDPSIYSCPQLKYPSKNGCCGFKEMNFILPPAPRARLRHGAHQEGYSCLAVRDRQTEGASIEPIPGVDGSHPIPPHAELDESNLTHSVFSVPLW